MTSQTEQRSQQGQPETQHQQGQGQRQPFDFQQLIDQGIGGSPSWSPSSQPGTGEALTLFSQAYFQQVEESVRSARRVTEVLALSYAKQEIVQQIKQEVMRDIVPLVVAATGRKTGSFQA